MRKPTQSRKLLIASVGVATISYVAACGREPVTSGNLVAPPQPEAAGAPTSGGEASVLVAGGAGGDAAIPPTSGNLVAPPPTTPVPKPTSTPPTSGNLVPPPKPTPPTSGNLVPPPMQPPTGGVKPPTKAH